jgi:hypothetical protein
MIWLLPHPLPSDAQKTWKERQLGEGKEGRGWGMARKPVLL